MLEKMFSWIKNHKIKCIVLVLSLFLIPMLIIQGIYWLGEIFPIIKTTFSASDVLSYYGAFLSGVGTVSLGALALWQNHIIQKQSEILQRKLLALEQNKDKPLFDFSVFFKGNSHSNPSFKIKNTGKGTAYGIVLKNLEKSPDPEYTYVPMDQERPFPHSLEPNKSHDLHYANSPGVKTESKLCFGVKIECLDFNNVPWEYEKYHFYHIQANGTVTENRME